MKRVFLIMISVTLTFPCLSFADGGYVLRRGVIASINNTYANKDQFAVLVSGGTGICADQTVIFPKSASDHPDVHSRAYTTALTAFLSGVVVSIYNYHAEDCLTASFIRLHK